MTTTQLDDNSQPCIYGLSSVDGVTPVRIRWVGAGMAIDDTTPVSVTPTMIKDMDQNSKAVAKGTSEANDSIVLPWYVVPSTGAVCVEPN